MYLGGVRVNSCLSHQGPQEMSKNESTRVLNIQGVQSGRSPRPAAALPRGGYWNVVLYFEFTSCVFMTCPLIAG